VTIIENPPDSKRDETLAKVPLQFIRVEPPNSPQEFMSLGDNDPAPVAFIFNRPLTSYEERVVREITDFQDAEVLSDGDFSDTGQGIVTVTLPFGRLSDTHKIVGDILSIPGKADNLQRYHRERMTTWQAVAANINAMLQQ
jgi:hypothetical protein